MMKHEIYEPPFMEKGTIILEQSIAGSVPIGPADPNNAFQEHWNEETIITGDIEIL